MIDCTITSSAKTVVYKNVQSITLPAHSGQMQILPDHAESFVLLREGNAVFKKQNGETEMRQITNGICYFKNNALVIIL